MHDCVFDDRLKNHARHQRVESVRGNVAANIEAVGKPNLLNFEVTIQKLQLLGQWDLLWTILVK